MKSVRVGLLGFGTVGQAFARLVERESPRILERDGVALSLVAIGNRRIDAKRASWAGDGVRWTEDLGSVVDAPDVDLVVELLGGLEPAGSLVARALERGKSVVTANKL